MPLQKGLGLYDDQRAAPFEKPRKRDQGQSQEGRRPPWLDLTFLEQGELLSEEQVLGNEREAGRVQQSEGGQQAQILQ